MKGNRIRKNNRGDSLILVIGCIALLSIIGIVLLAKSLDNRNMKLAEEQAQASFLGAESGSAEMIAIMDAVSHEVVEDAFSDMLVEYSLSDSNDDRKERYSQFFSKKVKEKLTADELQDQLEDALGGEEITDLTVECGAVDIEGSSDPNFTDVIRINDVTFKYTAAGSQTTIKTDICISARIPDVESGFNTGISCDFLDFGIVSDGDVTIATTEDLNMTGNFYAGGSLTTIGSNVATKINKAVKLLVKDKIIVEPGAQLWVNADGLSFQNGQGIWAGGIAVNGGIVNTNGVNVYVTDDLSVQGTDTSVVMQGAGAEYVGFSGGKSSLSNHEQSSAITINDSDNLTLDLGGLGSLYINGCSYICEGNDKWGTMVDGSLTAAEGILQGESIAYKDMQAMYLYPGDCLPQGHNPIIGDNVTVGAVNTLYAFTGPSGTEVLNLADYVDPANPYVTRTARLDGGATMATYVYLNFENEAKAAQFTRDYMETSKGDAIKSQISNLGIASKIVLPTETYTLANALSYKDWVVSMLPSAGSTQLPMLNSTCLLAKQRYRGLFSSLRPEAGVHVADTYRMVRDGILKSDAFNSLPVNGEDELTMADPDYSAETYEFYVYNGDLTISTDADVQKYRNIKGILIVNGDLTIAASPTVIDGLVLATGKTTLTAGATVTANKRAVEVLLTNPNVAKYFRVYGEHGGNGYLSSESVDISFENWQKN